MPNPIDAKALYNAAGESRVVYTEAEETDVRARGFTLPYTHQEYPKALYLGGDRNTPDRTVRNADEERAARAEGFKMIDKAHDAKSVAALAPVEAPVEAKVAVEKKPKK